MSGHVAIGSAIETLLGEIDGLNEVFSGPVKELSKYPCAMVIDMGWANQLHDTGGNVRNYSFRVTLFEKNDDPEAAEASLRSIADDVIAALETDVTLGGSCQYAKATSGNRGWTDREIPVTYFELTIEASDRLNR